MFESSPSNRATDSSPVAPRPLTVRSAVTNDMLWLRGVDGRSAAARRYRDLVISFADNLGGADKLGEAEKTLVRSAAAMALQVEGLQTRSVAGEDVDLEQLTRLANALGRTLQRLRLKKSAPKPPTLADYIAAKTAAKAPARPAG